MIPARKHILGQGVYQATPPPGKALIGGFCIRKRAVVSTVATVYIIQENHLKVFYLGLAVWAKGYPMCGLNGAPQSGPSINLPYYNCVRVP